MLSPILNYLSPLDLQERDPSALRWLMLWRLRGSSNTISWEDFLTMPEEAFDYFPRYLDAIEDSTYIKAERGEFVVTVIRQVGVQQAAEAVPWGPLVVDEDSAVRAWIMRSSARRRRPRMYKIEAKHRGTWSRRSVWADTFQAAILRAVKLSAKVQWRRDT